MNWLVLLILAIGIVLPAGAGLALGLYRASQSPEVLVGVSALLVKTLLPIIGAFVAARNTPAVEKRMKGVSNRAGEWDNFNKRERER